MCTSLQGRRWRGGGRGDEDLFLIFIQAGGGGGEHPMDRGIHPVRILDGRDGVNVTIIVLNSLNRPHTSLSEKAIYLCFGREI